MSSKQKIPLLIICIVGLLFFSCNTKTQKEYVIKPNTTAIKGDLSDFYEVVDGTYKIEKGESKYSDYTIKVPLKRTDKSFDFDVKDLAIYTDALHVYLDCDLLEANGTPIAIGSSFMGEGTNIEKRLLSLKSGETGWAEFKYPSGFKPEEMSKVKSFELRSQVKKPTRDNSSSGSTEDNSTTTASSNNDDTENTSADCDKFMKDYEAFLNSYIKLLKKYKANPTDATILNEYTEAVEEASKMENNVSLCTDPKYAIKLLELQTKLTKAAF